jgi:hypothetical protein
MDPRPRTAQRSWFEEFDELEAAGFVWRSEYSSGTKTCFCCGEDMEVRLFERRDVSYRAYALCVMCGWWFEL